MSATLDPGIVDVVLYFDRTSQNRSARTSVSPSAGIPQMADVRRLVSG